VKKEWQSPSGLIIFVCASEHATPEQVEEYVNIRYPQKTEERRWQIYAGAGQAKFGVPVTCKTPGPCDHYDDRIHYSLIDSAIPPKDEETENKETHKK